MTYDLEAYGIGESDDEVEDEEHLKGKSVLLIGSFPYNSCEFDGFFVFFLTVS